MAVIIQSARIEVKVHITLDEDELAALKHMTEWGITSLMEALKTLSQSEFKKHQPALEKWFKAIQATAPGILTRAEEARQIFHR